MVEVWNRIQHDCNSRYQDKNIRADCACKHENTGSLQKCCSVNAEIWNQIEEYHFYNASFIHRYFQFSMPSQSSLNKEFNVTMHVLLVPGQGHDWNKWSNHILLATVLSSVNLGLSRLLLWLLLDIWTGFDCTSITRDSKTFPQNLKHSDLTPFGHCKTQTWNLWLLKPFFNHERSLSESLTEK